MTCVCVTGSEQGLRQSRLAVTSPCGLQNREERETICRQWARLSVTISPIRRHGLRKTEDTSAVGHAQERPGSGHPLSRAPVLPTLVLTMQWELGPWPAWGWANRSSQSMSLPAPGVAGSPRLALKVPGWQGQLGFLSTFPQHSHPWRGGGEGEAGILIKSWGHKGLLHQWWYPWRGQPGHQRQRQSTAWHRKILINQCTKLS